MLDSFAKASAAVSIALGVAFPESRFDASCQCVVTDSNGWIEGLAIFLAALLVVVVSSSQDYDKELKFRKLELTNVRFITVIRDDRQVEINTDEVVVGDIVCLELGAYVPCDGIIVTSHSLKIDESAVTGEPDAISKGVGKDPWMLSNTPVSDGSGRMIATATGEHSEWGKTLLSLQGDELEDTPLQELLNDMVITIGKFGLCASLCVS